jgi:murein tripeptide amidase MpaA
VGDKFDCLSLTLEMPFKDNDDLKDYTHGWDGRRSYLLGQSFLTAINMVVSTIG